MPPQAPETCPDAIGEEGDVGMLFALQAPPLEGELRKPNSFTNMFPLSTYNLSIGYLARQGKRVVQAGLNLQLRPGELVGLIGPNGSGKSTLMRTLAGLQPPLAGQVTVAGRDLHDLPQRDIARLIALVLTDRVEVDNATVRDIVTLGRYPHAHWWGGTSPADRQAVDEAIDLVHLADKAARPLSELSDGERQRAMIARALAQDTPIILLDEPTAHLDLPNRVETMLLLHRLAHQTQKSILLSTHELDLALQAADRIWLLSADHGMECGVPEDLVLNGSFGHVFASPNYYFNPSNGNFSMHYSLHRQVSVSGDKTRLYWTLRALARAGYEVVEHADTHIRLTATAWLLDDRELPTVEALLEALGEADG